MTSLKPGSGRTEDKIGGALNIAILVVLPALLVGSQEGVLVTEEPASAKNSPVTVDMHSHGLAELLGIVLKGDPLGSESRTLNPDGVGPESAHVAYVGMVIPGDDSAFSTLALHEEIGHPCRDHNLFPVGAALNEHIGSVRHICPDRVHRLLHRGEFTAAVGRNGDVPCLAEEYNRLQYKRYKKCKPLHYC